MKHKSLAYLFLAAGTAFAASAMAQGTITFSGQVTANTCTSKINGAGSGDGVIVLPTAQIAHFPTNNSGGLTPLPCLPSTWKIALLAYILMPDFM